MYSRTQGSSGAFGARVLSFVCFASNDGFCPQSGLVQRELCMLMLPADSAPLVAAPPPCPLGSVSLDSQTSGRISIGRRLYGQARRQRIRPCVFLCRIRTLRLPTNPVPLPPPKGGTMGAGQWRQFEFMAAEKRKPYNLAVSVGRFIGRSFCVQAKDKLRPTWRPSAGSPQQKCTPIPASRDFHLKVKRLTTVCASLTLLQNVFAVHPGGGSFSGAMP